MLIPKIFHRVWIGKAELPAEYNEFWQGWKKLHPNWQFFDWRDEDIRDLSLYPLLKKIKCPASASDIARYEILFNYGGVYIDCDFECKQPIDTLIQDVDFVACNQVPDFNCFCSNGFFAASPKNKILHRAIEDLKDLEANTINSQNPAEITGPYFFRRVINNKKITLLDTFKLYPYFHFKGDIFKGNANDIYAIHHWGGSWLSEDVLLGLAKKQFFSGDPQSCTESIQKIDAFRQLTSASFLYKLAKVSIFCKKIFFLICLKPILYLCFVYGYFKLSISENKLSSPTQDTSGNKQIQRSTKYNFKSLLKKILKKSTNTIIAKAQYPHLLDYVFANQTIETVVEIGAMNGKSFDRLYPYLKQAKEVKALFVEPVQEHYQELLNTYQDFQLDDNKFYFENCAVTEEAGDFSITRIPNAVIESERLPDWVGGISSLVPQKNALTVNEELVYTAEFLEKFIIQEKIKGKTFQSLIDKYVIDKISVLQIDTEGYDFIILNQALQTSIPDIICFEWISLSSQERAKAIKLLKKMNYLFFLNFNKEDLIACKPRIYYGLAASVYSKYSVLLLPLLR